MKTTESVMPPIKSQRVTSADRLGFTLFVAAVVHVAVILGVGFVVQELPAQSKSLEITLSTFSSESEPDKADFIAQDNQQGSGTLEHEAAPKTTELADFQDNKIQQVQVQSAPEAIPEIIEQKKIIATTTAQKDKVVTTPNPSEKTEAAPSQPIIDNSQLSAEIASLEAELALERQEYAKRPRVSRQNAAATKRDISAEYRDEWRRKVERIGNLNYPDEARQQGIYGSLRLLVIIKNDGSLEEMRILESSGQLVLDRAALDIVRKSAPFSHFTGDLAANYDQVEIIRTWRFERGNVLSSQ